MNQPTTMERLFADDGSYVGVAEVTTEEAPRMIALHRHRPGAIMSLSRMTMAVRLGITRILLERRA
jgi:hypothetical protein